MDDTLANISAWCSIIGLIISVITLILAGTISHAVNKQRKTLIFNIRLPEHSSSLKEICSRYLDIHDKINQPTNIRDLLYKIKTKLELLKNGAPDSVTRDINRTIKKINKYYQCSNYTTNKKNGKQVNTDDLFTVYTETHGIITKLDELINTKGYGY